jgi:hypothetical protein
MRSRSAAAGVVLAAVIVLGLVALLYWAFPGQLAFLGREVWASATLKWVIVAAVIGVAAFFLGSERAITAVVVIAVVGGIAVIPSAIAGGFHRQVQHEATVREEPGTQPSYNWRQPWSTAAKSALSRAGNVVGDIDTDTTTYLPGQDSYSTPVVARGLIAGYGQVITQSPGRSTAQVCDFERQVPRPGGWFGFSLMRAVARVDAGVAYQADDVWAYCDSDDVAHLVVPVTRYAGFPESHRVPAGVVIFDGDGARLATDVEPGDLPGPVYPMSLAAAQRASTVAADGWWSKFRNRAGYETTTGTADEADESAGEGEDAADQPDATNPSELLLARASGRGWDYVTALTPRGASSSVIAVATVRADSVSAGQLNDVDLFVLDEARMGNRALAQDVESKFPELNWRGNDLTVKEVLPTSAGVWTATVANATAATRRVESRADGTLCLTDLDGTEVRCVDASGADSGDDGDEPAQGDDETPTAPTGDLAGLSDADLLDLQRAVTDELEARLLAGERVVEQG